MRRSVGCRPDVPAAQFVAMAIVWVRRVRIDKTSGDQYGPPAWSGPKR